MTLVSNLSLSVLCPLNVIMWQRTPQAPELIIEIAVAMVNDKNLLLTIFTSRSISVNAVFIGGTSKQLT